MKEITVIEFVDLLDREQQISCRMAYQALLMKAALRRFDLANILHLLLINYYKEADEVDYSSALYLKDLYDCNKCMAHVAQVYSKGIMPAFSEGIFAGNELVDVDMAKACLYRLANPSERRKPPARTLSFKTIYFEQVDDEFLKSSSNLFVDVRTSEEFRLYPIIANSINCPLNEVIKNPYGVSGNINQPIYVFCNKGYQSALAALLLIKSGYCNVTRIIKNDAGEMEEQVEHRFFTHK